MPRIKAQDVKPYDIYGQDDTDVSLTIRERLMTRFAAHEHVQVFNCDDETVEWQFLPDYAERSSLTDEGIKITDRDDPELWALEPGETDILSGACAYHMIETLYKKMVIKKVGIVEHPQSGKEVKNFNFKDPIRAEQIINLIFIGKVSPSFNQSQPAKIAVKKKNAKELTQV